MGSLHLQEDGYPQETYLQRYSKAQNFEGPWSHELSQAMQPQHLWKPGYHHRQPEKSIRIWEELKLAFFFTKQ